jgi:tetratricopeptide (TPR) repeat protein
MVTNGVKKNFLRRHPIATGLILFCWLLCFLAWRGGRNAPRERQLDFSQPIQTKEHAIVCPKALIMTMLLSHNAEEEQQALWDAFSAFSDRDEKARAAGCDIWDGGIPVRAEHMQEPFDQYVSITPLDGSGSYFSMAANLENGPANEASTIENNLASSMASSSTLGGALVANPSTQPIPKGDVVAPKNGFGAVICSDSAGLAAYDDDAMAAFASSTAAEPQVPDFSGIAKSHGCSFVPPGTTLSSEGPNSTASLAIVTAQLSDGTTVHGVTFPTMITQAEIPASGTSIEPAGVGIPASVGSSDVNTSTAPSAVHDPEQSKKMNASGLRDMSGPQPDYAAAKQDFEQAVQLDPTNVEALNNLGYAYIKLGNYQTAESILNEVIVMAPTRKTAETNLAEAEAELGKSQDAINHLCRFVHMFNSPEYAKKILAQASVGRDANIQSVVNATISNCN